MKSKRKATERIFNSGGTLHQRNKRLKGYGIVAFLSMSFSFDFLPDADISPPVDPDSSEPSTWLHENETKKKNETFSWIQNESGAITHSTGESISLVNGRQDHHDAGSSPVNQILRVREESSSFQNRNTDLVPGFYEGGLKVWECSIDLCRYFHLNNILIQGHILELGCGHGLPGIWLLKQAISKSQQESVDSFVTFSDYNEFVIRDVTVPNVAINIRDSYSDGMDSMNGLNQIEHLLNENTAFGSGDWMVMSDLLLGKNTEIPPAAPRGGLFDCILASETTYSENAANETAELLSKHMKPGTGVAYISSKRYYFGVGGGTKCLCESLRKQKSHEFEIETLEVFDNGAGNIRELLLVKSLGLKG